MIYSRLVLPKLLSYSLNDLYKTRLNKVIKNAHFALPDAISLHELIVNIGLESVEGPIYPFHCTSLQVVKWLGPSCEKILFSNNLTSLEDLKQFLLSSFTHHCLNIINISFKEFIVWKITNIGIKPGNAVSIANSLTERWL